MIVRAKRIYILIIKVNTLFSFFVVVFSKGPFTQAVFVAPKLHQVSNMFKTPAISRWQIAVKFAPGLHVRFRSCNFSATKIASSCRNKNCLCKWALKAIENMFSVFVSSYRNTCESLGEIEKAVETLACSTCSISHSPKLPLVFLLHN